MMPQFLFCLAGGMLIAIGCGSVSATSWRFHRIIGFLVVALGSATIAWMQIAEPRLLARTSGASAATYSMARDPIAASTGAAAFGVTNPLSHQSDSPVDSSVPVSSKERIVFWTSLALVVCASALVLVSPFLPMAPSAMSPSSDISNLSVEKTKNNPIATNVGSFSETTHAISDHESSLEVVETLGRRLWRPTAFFRILAIAGGATGLAAASLLSTVARLGTLEFALSSVNVALGGLLLGAMTSAWLLGHAYLTATRMTIAPLRTLSRLLSLAVAARATFVILSLTILWVAADRQQVDAQAAWIGAKGAWLILFLRLGLGIAGVALFAYMVSDCVRRRATQSATGILYFASTFAYIGELASIHLSQDLNWPV